MRRCHPGNLWMLQPMTRPVFTDAEGHQIRYELKQKHCITSDDFEGDVDDVINLLQTLKQDAGEDVRLEDSWSRDDEDDHRRFYDLYTYRYETDTERDARVAREERDRLDTIQREQERERNTKAMADNRAQNERSELLRLLKIHGHPVDWK